MAAQAFTLLSNAVLGLSQGKFNLGSDTFVCTLLTNSYVPAPNADTLWTTAISATELAPGLGYNTGGVVLASETDTLTAATVTFTAASPSWANFSAGPFRYAMIVRRAAAALAATDLLLCYSDLTGAGSISGTGGSFTVTINVAGIFALTHSP